MIISIAHEKVICKREISREKKNKAMDDRTPKSYRVSKFIYIFVVVFLFLYFSDTWHAILLQLSI